MAPIHLALCGRSPNHVSYLVQELLPEYEVIHVCTSLETAVSELPALLRGESINISSGFGTNATSNRQSPVSGTKVKAIIVGGAFPTEAFEAIRAACDAVRPLPYFRADAQGATAPPPADVLLKRLEEGMEKAPTTKGEGGGWDVDVYMF